MVKPRDEFVDLMRTARETAYLLAAALTTKGYNIRILPNSISPNEKDRWNHTDHGDLEIIQRIEVKHWPDIDFKSVEDITYKNIIVDEAYKIEAKHQSSLFAYMILNASVTGYILIPVWTKRQWFKEEKFDKREGRMRLYYFCPKSHLTYHCL